THLRLDKGMPSPTIRPCLRWFSSAGMPTLKPTATRRGSGTVSIGRTSSPAHRYPHAPTRLSRGTPPEAEVSCLGAKARTAPIYSATLGNGTARAGDRRHLPRHRLHARGTEWPTIPTGVAWCSLVEHRLPP